MDSLGSKFRSLSDSITRALPILTRMRNWPGQRLELADAICPSPHVRGCCSLDNAQDTFSGGSDATARFHHGTWYCGYVATPCPSAATSEDEADRFRSPFDQSQRNKRERKTAVPRFFRGAKSPWLRRGPKPRGGTLLWRRASRTLCRTGPRCRQHASRLDCNVGRSSIVRLQNGDDDSPDCHDDRRSDCPGTCGKHRAAGRQHYRRCYRCWTGNHWKTYGAAGRGDAKTVRRWLPCIATILGRSKRYGNARGGQKGGGCVVACY